MSNAEDTSYERIAEVYLASTDQKPFTKYYERPFIIHNLPPLHGKVVMDVGCATGYYSRHCIENGAEVISIDASEKMIKHTARLCDHRNRSYVHDIAEPFNFVESGSIDIIICSLVLHYIEDWENTLGEFHRMLRKGGTCIVSTHHPINDFTYFSQQDYFSKKLIEDEWTGFKQPMKVKYFVRPLHEYMQPMIECKLTLRAIREPGPVEILKQEDEKTYNRLLTRPTFLFYILEKDAHEDED